MANPTVKTGIPKYSSLMAALWVSDQIDQGGPAKGAWDALTGTFYPAYGGSNLTPVQVGAGPRNALRSAAAVCGIDLNAAVDLTTGPFNELGSEFTIAALVRRESSNASNSLIIQNTQRFSPTVRGGYRMLMVDTATASTNEYFGASGGTSLSKTTGYPFGEWMLIVYKRGADGVGKLYRNDVSNHDTDSANSSARVLGDNSMGRQPALFNWGSTQSLTAVPIDIAAVLLFRDGDITVGDIQGWGGTSSANVLVDPDAVLNAIFDFGDSPTGPTIDTEPAAQTANEGSTAVFTVAATSSGGTLHYQWKRQPPGGGAFANVGTDSNTYTTSTLDCATDHLAQIYCQTSDDNGPTDSATVGLSVRAVSTISRPGADVTDNGWTASTGSDLFAMIDETSASTADYIESPALSASPVWSTIELKYPLPTGDRIVDAELYVTSGTGTLKIRFVNDAGSVMGTAADQAVTSTPTIYSLAVTLTGPATRIEIAAVL